MALRISSDCWLMASDEGLLGLGGGGIGPVVVELAGCWELAFRDRALGLYSVRFSELDW